MMDNDSQLRIESAKAEIFRKRSNEGPGRTWLELACEAADDYGLNDAERIEFFRQLG